MNRSEYMNTRFNSNHETSVRALLRQGRTFQCARIEASFYPLELPNLPRELNQRGEISQVMSDVTEVTRK